MNLSILLAKFWSGILIIPSLAFLIRKPLLANLYQLAKDKTFIIFSGYLALILGLITVILHNLWVADWRVAITILGWISLLKGILRLTFPENIEKLLPFFKKNPLVTRTFLVLAILLAAWLIWSSKALL
jgi:hypothetical protein